MAKVIKKAQVGTVVKPKAKPTVKAKPKPRYQTPADFYPADYDKRFPRTPGGGDNYDVNIQREKERVAKGLPAYKKGGVVKKYATGGSLKGLKASTKRVGPVDRTGAYTKVQEKTLAGSKGSAPLTKDKQLGATKMKKGGMMKKCKYGCK